jgi:Spy/CpxP family protein refolding chaperone
MQNLDLTDSQQAALDKIRNETCAQIEPLASQISAAELYKTLSAEEINETEAAAKIAEIVGLKSQIKTIMLNSRLASALILTPEQRQELSDEVGNCKNWQPKGSGWMRR